MKIGLVSDSLYRYDYPAMLDWCAANGVESAELGTGNFSPAPHCRLATLLADAGARDDLLRAAAQRGVEIGALNCSGNVLDASLERREKSQQVFFETLRLAGLLGVKTVVAMSGCPGDVPDTGRYPNWVTTNWQPEYVQLLEWQWQEVIRPFWERAAQAARDAQVRIAIEMHPGQAVYNPYTMFRLREITGDVVGINLDPSHLFWQGIEPLRVVEAMHGMIYHVHAKDCWFDAEEMALNGALDARVGKGRSWEHCLLGQGHAEEYWHRFVSALSQAGFDGALSIEYAGSRDQIESGIAQNVGILQRARAACAQAR